MQTLRSQRLRTAIISPGSCGRPCRGVSIVAYDSARKSIAPLGHQNGFPNVHSPLTWYSCGPTVYDSAHLGHARTYVALDLLRRVTDRYSGTGTAVDNSHGTGTLHRPLTYAMGITDIDDKILVRAAEKGIHPSELSARYEAEFWRDMSCLGVAPPDAVLRVTEHIPDIVDYIQRILDNKLAYIVPGSGVYLDVAALGDRYGSLGPPHAHVPCPLPSVEEHAPAHEHAQSEPRIAASPNEQAAEDYEVPVAGKRDKRDFALWKLSPSEAGAGSSWPSPWGPGRPGWHIECSAMTHAWRGTRLDVHAGGIDLAFPHHCNEIAQSIAYAAQPQAVGHVSRWVGSWIHTGHLHIAGRKMSKSLKNFITIQDMLTEATSSASTVSASDCYRMFTAMHSYRSTLSYTPDRLTDARVFASKLQEAAAGLLATVSTRRRSGGPVSRWSTSDKAFVGAIHSSEAQVVEALTNDFDLPQALREISSQAAAATMYAHGSGTAPNPALVTRALASILEPLSMMGFHFAEDALAALRALQRAQPATSSLAQAGVSGMVQPGTSVAASSQDAAEAIVHLRQELKNAGQAMQKASKVLKKAAVKEGHSMQETAQQLDEAGKACYTRCDRVRDVELPSLGWKLKDTAQGPVLTPTTPSTPSTA